MTLITLPEAVEQFGLDYNTIQRWVYNGWLHTEREGRRHLVDPEDVQWVIDHLEELRQEARRRGIEAARRTVQEKARHTDRKCPPHLLPALHLFIRAVAVGHDFNTRGHDNPFATAARRVILVERSEDVERVTTETEIRECFDEDSERRMRWNGRRWVA